MSGERRASGTRRASLEMAAEAARVRSLAAQTTEASKRWRINWHYTSASFGVMSTVSVLILAYSTSLLRGNLGSYASGSLYLCWLFSSSLLGAPVTAYLGPKRALVLASAGYCVYYCCFVLSFFISNEFIGSAVVMFGYCCCGISAGPLWTAEGVYFARSAKLVADAEGGNLEDHSNGLASIFAAWNLGPEVILKLTVSFLQTFDSIAAWIPMAMACGLAIAATVFMQVMCEELPEEEARAVVRRMSTVQKLSQAGGLWKDPVIWLLGFTNFTFGFAAAFLNGRINPGYSMPQLGLQWIGIFGAVVSGVATLVQVPMQKTTVYFGKGPVLALGSLAFMSLPIMTLTLPMHSLGHWLALFYVFYGVARAVFESTNRAIFADFFPPPRSQEAFANVAMQQAMSFATCYFIQVYLSDSTLAIVLLSLSASIMPGFLVAAAIRRSRQAEEEGQAPLVD